MRRFEAEQLADAKPRFATVGELAFWLCLIAATALCILALARPQASVTSAVPAAADIVVLLDGSASMHAADVPRHSLATLSPVRSLARRSDELEGRPHGVGAVRVRASPQVRLTRDPNALFFFLDHLGEKPPFSLDDATTWDTNIEEGIHWGLRLVERPTKACSVAAAMRRRSS